MALPQLPQDKANHFIYGAIIYLIASFILEPYPAFFIVGSVAFLKEFYDTYTPSADFSFKDFFSTISGGLLIFIAQHINHL